MVRPHHNALTRGKGGAAGALLVYDITSFVRRLEDGMPLTFSRFASRQSFANVSRWLTDCRALASSHLVLVLVGNKLDREEEREVEFVEGSRWAQENGERPLCYIL